MMTDRLSRFPAYGYVAPTYLLIHAVVIAWWSSRTHMPSYLFMIGAPWLAFLACAWRAARSPKETRSRVILLSIAIAFWGIGMTLAVWSELSGAPDSLADYNDIFYFVYGVPLLLVISHPVHEDQRDPARIWLDGIQVLATALFVYLTLFSYSPASDGSPGPLPAELLERIYNIENGILAFGACLKLAACWKNEVERRFYGQIALYLIFYLVGAGVYNAISVDDAPTGFYDLLPVVPFLVLFTLMAADEKAPYPAPQRGQSNPLALMLDHASPSLFTVALIGLGVWNMQRWFKLSVGAIGLAVLIYVAKNALLHGRYVSTQRSLREARDRLEEMALRDPLTCIPNRRHFDQVFELEWGRAARSRGAISLLMIDLDDFKSLNDRYGHAAGDRCLVKTARALEEMLHRNADLVARYGGEEFAVVLVDSDEHGALLVAERMRAGIAALGIPNPNPRGDFLTASIGVATLRPAPGDLAQTLFDASDAALYAAKDAGRDCVRIHVPSHAPSQVTSPFISELPHAQDPQSLARCGAGVDVGETYKPRANDDQIIV